MATSLVIVGQSGTGKSTSMFPNEKLGIKGLDPKKTVYINVSSKALPVKGWTSMYNQDIAISKGGNYLGSFGEAKTIAQTIIQLINYVSQNRPDIDNLVIDDAQYIMAFENMSRAKESGYGKFTDIGVNINNVLAAVRSARPNLNVILTWHPDKTQDGGYKMKTVGKPN